MNILIVDDHELVRGGLARIVAEEFPNAQIQEASDGIRAEKLGRAKKMGSTHYGYVYAG